MMFLTPLHQEVESQEAFNLIIKKQKYKKRIKALKNNFFKDMSIPLP